MISSPCGQRMQTNVLAVSLTLYNRHEATRRLKPFNQKHRSSTKQSCRGKQGLTSPALSVEVILERAVHDELVAEQLLLGAVVVPDELHQVPVVQPAQHLHLHLELAVALVAPDLRPAHDTRRQSQEECTI